MLSQENRQQLEKEGYHYTVSARLANAKPCILQTLHDQLIKHDDLHLQRVLYRIFSSVCQRGFFNRRTPALCYNEISVNENVRITMPHKMPIGVDIFYELTAPENNFLYVDKSLWIKEVIEDNNKTILLTRPRRWGKTLNLSMLQHFFASQVVGRSTRGMFDNLQIAQIDDGRYMTHQGRYPVIFVSLKSIKEPDFDSAVNRMRSFIQELYREHSYLLIDLADPYKAVYAKGLQGQFNDQELKLALKFLSEVMYVKTGQPAYILIDEYDSPFVHASMQGYLEPLTDFFKSFFSEALKTNPYLKKGIMTGILRIAKENMLSDLNNLEVYTILNQEHQQYFGFTEAEVDGLFQVTGLNHDVARVKQLYNGYKIGEIVVYNPWSIVQCISHKGALRPYWVNTASDGLLKTALLNQAATADIKIKFEQLLAGNVIAGIVNERVSFEDVERGDESAIWSLLLFSGYLKAVAVEPRRTHYQCQLAIPNEEVAMLYYDVFSDWLVKRSNRASYDRLLSSLI